MKTLYLLRHGHAEDKGKGPDFERNLDDAGREEVRHTARQMQQLKIQPALVISSPANRALQTASLAAETIGYPPDKIVQERNIYYTDVSKLFEILHEQDDSFESILLAGHNPSISQMAGMLSTEIRDYMPTAGLVAFEIDSESWNDFEKNNVRFLYNIF